MAARNEDLKSETERIHCFVVGKNGGYGGYKKEILVENLSQREKTVFMCNRCQGIMREVCTSSDGEQFCFSCKKEGEQTHPNKQTDRLALTFKCFCPLIEMGCGWLGTLRDCECHLETCDYVYVMCEFGCGVVLQRNELDVHERENCSMRIVRCEHCDGEYHSCAFHTHLDKCPIIEVSCELCVKMMCRKDMAQHLKKDCVENEIACPFVKYKCEVTSIQRKYLSQHLEEKRTEHLELKLTAMELKLNAMDKLILKQNLTIEKQNKNISELNREMEISSRRFSKGTEGLRNRPIPQHASSNEEYLAHIAKRRSFTSTTVKPTISHKSMKANKSSLF